MNKNVQALPKWQQEFLHGALLAAQASRRKTGIPASVVAAQCLLESDWGRSTLSKQGRNYFGVKGDRGWQGAVLLMPTKEFVRGEWITITARFRKYDSLQDSVADHADFLKAPRYAEAWKHKNNYREFARAIHRAGYATDPEYSDKLIRVIECYGLQHYDFPIT